MPATDGAGLTPDSQGWLDVGDTRLYYESFGDGTPLVLLHGNGEDGRLFASQVALFCNQYRVITIDSRGHGKSPRGTAPYSLQQMATDLGAALIALDIDHCHLLGFSDGGNIALLYALRDTSRLCTLTLVGANLDPGGVKAQTQLLVCLGVCLCQLFAFSAKARHSRDTLRLMLREPHIAPAQLAAIATPTLVVAGQNDVIKESHTRLIAQSLPNARLDILPDADHFALVKQPDIFNAVVDDFLAAHTH